VLELLYAEEGVQVGVEGGKTMPSSRRYSRKAGGRGIMRDLRAEDLFLFDCQL
jgi:hypothetical protein